jgi:uncharacterized RDD family membrane protein YckC
VAGASPQSEHESEATPPLAGYGARALGFFIDLLPAWVVVGGIAGLVHLTPAAGLSLILLGWGIYNFGFLWLLDGQTPGMRVVGLLAVDESTGETPTVAQVAARSAAATLIFAATMLGTFGLLGPAADLLWANFDRRSQNLHDKLGRTVVLKVAR